MIDYGMLKAQLIEAAVTAINGTLTAGLIAAEKDVPVRKIFAGGRQTVRFKTAQEIEADKGVRQRLGLAPEYLATPEKIAAVKAAGKNPKTSFFAARGLETGFARTISHPKRGRPNRAGLTPAQRGLVENRADRANDQSSFFGNARVVIPGTTRSDETVFTRSRLLNPEDEFGLSARGRYELKHRDRARDDKGNFYGRAFAARTLKIADTAEINARTGEVVTTQYREEKSKVTRLGGALRDSLRIERASASSYPVIEGWLIAGNAEVDYAKYQELGTRHNPAHPFLRPRLPEWKTQLPEQLRRSLGRVGR